MTALNLILILAAAMLAADSQSGLDHARNHHHTGGVLAQVLWRPLGHGAKLLEDGCGVVELFGLITLLRGLIGCDRKRRGDQHRREQNVG